MGIIDSFHQKRRTPNADHDCERPFIQMVPVSGHFNVYAVYRVGSPDTAAAKEEGPTQRGFEKTSGSIRSAVTVTFGPFTS
jgi:hypothetical protein